MSKEVNSKMTEKIDPELVDDRDLREVDVENLPLPDYDPSEFELPDDYEYVEVDEDGEDDGD